MAFTSLEELEQRITQRRAVELFDDDGDNVIAGTDLDAVNAAIDQVQDELVSIIFRKGFSLLQISKLEPDKSLRRYATDMLAQLAGERRTEFLRPDGKGAYDLQGTRARDCLKLMSTGELRSRLEEDTNDPAGPNPIVGGDVSTGTPVFIVSRNPNVPGSRGPGGF